MGNVFQHAPRLSQYLVRLIELPENAGLRTTLRQRITADAAGAERLSMLPKRLRQLLEEA